MLVEDLFGGHHTKISPFTTIQQSCSQFLDESVGFPLYRNLPVSYNDIHRVKVRAKKKATAVNEVFNRAFEENYINLAQRAVFAQSRITERSSDAEPFYIFPINGYKYIYSREITESTSEYQQVIATLFEQLKDEQAATDIVTDLLKFSYTSHELLEGINSGSEIILYGIPYYYAVRCACYPEYAEIFSN